MFLSNCECKLNEHLLSEMLRTKEVSDFVVHIALDLEYRVEIMSCLGAGTQIEA